MAPVAAAPFPGILARARSSAGGPCAGRPAPWGSPLAGPPFVIEPARCNRCGACLRLDCGAISDEGGEALVVDAGACTGCGACAPLCRARAIGASGAR